MSQPVSEEASSPAEAHSAQNPRVSFGSWLRHQREARSVSLREIADSSKISLRYLEALEQDRFDVLPAPVFARGFLREYARVVGLNPDEVVNLYLVVQEERAESPKPVRVESSSAAPSSLGYGLLLGLAVVVFVGIAALLSFFAERRKGVAPVSKLVAPTTMVSSAPATKTAAASSESAAMSEPAAVPAGPAATSAGGSQAPAVPAVPGVAAVARPFRVVLNFSLDCWMESVVDGSRRTSELKAAGETVHLEAQHSVILTLGNSRAVTVEVDGLPFTLPESSTRVIRDLKIERPVRDPSSSSTPPVKL